MPGRFAETVGLDSCRLRRQLEFFFPGKNSDLGAGSAGLRCRAGGAAGWWNALKRTHFESISGTYAFERHVGGLAWPGSRLCRKCLTSSQKMSRMDTGGTLSQFWLNVPPPGGAAGRLLCRAGSAAGMWRARYRSLHGLAGMPGRNVMLESTSGTCAFKAAGWEAPMPGRWRCSKTQVALVFSKCLGTGDKHQPFFGCCLRGDCAARRHATREINESASVSQLR